MFPKLFKYTLIQNSLTDEEIEITKNGGQGRSRPQSFGRRFYIILLCSTIVTGLIIGIIYVARPASSQVPHPNPKNVLCPLPFNQIQMFRRHPEFEDATDSADDNWNAIFPLNGGVLVQVHEEDGKRHEFGIAMFHQLHCLQSIRLALREVSSSQHENHNGKRDTGSPGHHAMDHGHVAHCVDYLRQVGICLVLD